MRESGIHPLARNAPHARTGLPRIIGNDRTDLVLSADLTSGSNRRPIRIPIIVAGLVTPSWDAYAEGSSDRPPLVSAGSAAR